MQLPEDSTGSVVVKKEVVKTGTNTSVSRNRLTKSDPYLIERIVGYQEYGKALYYFDRLVSMCDEYELDAIEEIVSAEPEFKFYTFRGASEIVNRKVAQKDLEMSEERHGFRWVTALARVEIGAMKSGFSEHRRPFPISPGYDAEEYGVLLREGARLHYWSLGNDPAFAALARRFTPTSLTLSYLRRLNIGTGFSFSGGLMAFGGGQPRVLANKRLEMSNYATKLNYARGAIKAKIVAFLSQVSVKQATTTKKTQDLALAELCHAGVCKQFDTD